MAHLKLVLFFTPRNLRKHNFPRKTSYLVKRVLIFTDSEIYLLTRIFFLKIRF